jgi:hypothetical protein
MSTVQNLPASFQRDSGEPAYISERLHGFDSDKGQESKQEKSFILGDHFVTSDSTD